MIEVEGLTKDYGPRRAIDRISFHAEQGEILGFLGPNGAGKTTTMRILCGYMPPTAGEARVAGFDVVDQSLEVRRRVGYLPENVPLYPYMKVYDYLLYMADLRKLPDPDERVEDALVTVQLEDRAAGLVGNLSKGLKQRVGLAQALLHQPEVLILDEPTIGLDPAQIIGVRRLIQEIGAERTVLLSTHILSEAQQICDRVLIINEGEIVAEDTPERLQARLTGSQRIAIHIRGEGEGLEQVLEGIPGVMQVGDVRDGQVEVSMAPGQDVRPQVARAAVEGGFDLLELREVGMSLEDIFLQLTREAPRPPELVEDVVTETQEGEEV